jgi:hypothetical protein
MSSPDETSAYVCICDAMEDAGLIGEGDEPSSEQLAKYLRKLNKMINTWQTQGLRLWLQYDLPVPLVAGQNPYTIGPGGNVNMTRPLRVLDSCYYLDQYQNRRNLIALSRDDWSRLSQVTQIGQINSYFVDKQQYQLIVWFWLVPDTNAATGTVHLLIQQQVEQLVSITDDMNFPIEWFLALEWGLADQICTGQPEVIVDRCEKMAAKYFDALNNWDSEDSSTSFAPDQRSFVGQVGNFT